jgi:hypothetical protein
MQSGRGPSSLPRTGTFAGLLAQKIPEAGYEVSYEAPIEKRSAETLEVINTVLNVTGTIATWTDAKPARTEREYRTTAYRRDLGTERHIGARSTAHRTDRGDA